MEDTWLARDSARGWTASKSSKTLAQSSILKIRPTGDATRWMTAAIAK